ncbi:S-layer homology domain-containing protein [Cytobacillus gottheilii]|uniref:S-layer homology domain-containing protein n=1 Tax=Cytobacillus gottheilii TaxID=859144 RepID=UPI00249537E4|nr:S-layer homology domain-containing protein [Cytobacillus gottheilii]
MKKNKVFSYFFILTLIISFFNVPTKTEALTCYSPNAFSYARQLMVDSKDNLYVMVDGDPIRTNGSLMPTHTLKKMDTDGNISVIIEDLPNFSSFAISPSDEIHIVTGDPTGEFKTLIQKIGQDHEVIGLDVYIDRLAIDDENNFYYGQSRIGLAKRDPSGNVTSVDYFSKIPSHEVKNDIEGNIYLYTNTRDESNLYRDILYRIDHHTQDVTSAFLSVPNASLNYLDIAANPDQIIAFAGGIGGTSKISRFNFPEQVSLNDLESELRFTVSVAIDTKGNVYTIGTPVTGSGAVNMITPAGEVTRLGEPKIEPQKPVIYLALKNQEKTIGESAEFLTEGYSCKFDHTYEWYKDGVKIEGQNNKSFKIDSVTSSDTGNYTVRVQNSAGYVESTATLTIKGESDNSGEGDSEDPSNPTPNPGGTTDPDPTPNPGGTTDPAPTPPPADDHDDVPSTEIITVDVDGENGENLNKTPIHRTTELDGSVKDNVSLPAAIAKETVEKGKNSGNETARILIPDEKDIVTETNVTVPKTSLSELKNGNMNLEIFTENARVVIPKVSLTDFNEDLYFRFIPIKKEVEQQEVMERAKKEDIVKEALGDGTIEIVGRPMTIETNLTSRQVDLIMPLLGVTLPSEPKEQQDYLNNLGIFIEHSDGEKVLVRPELVEYKNGVQGLEFTIDKFSTFTIVKMDNLDAYFDNIYNVHLPYIHGFKDGTFRPEAAVKRSEMAAMLARNLPEDTELSKVSNYKDIPVSYWGYEDIMKAKQSGIMTGYSDHTFNSQGEVTRAQMATIAYRWMKNECGEDNGSYASCSSLKDNGVADYRDVSAKHWAIEAISFMKNANVMEGYTDNSFRPEEKLTRAQAVKVLNRIFKRGPLNGVPQASFKDVSKQHGSFKEIEEAALTHSYTINENGEEDWRPLQ